MNNGMTPQKLGWFLVACCLAAYVGFYLAVSKANAETEWSNYDIMVSAMQDGTQSLELTRLSHYSCSEKYGTEDKKNLVKCVNYLNKCDSDNKTCLKLFSAGDNLSPTARDHQRLNACTNASIRPDIPGKDQVKEAIKCAAWGKAVSHIESAKGTSRYAKTRNNSYGIMNWNKNKVRSVRKFKTTAEADAKWAQLWFDGYRKLGYKAFATRWTGESHAVKHYSAFLSKFVPQYLKLYTSLTK
jgi:hypothetical protein